MPTMEIVTLPDRAGRFAVGLMWEHEPEQPKARTLREIARSRGRWGMVRRTSAGSFQIGYGDLPEDTARPGQVRSLASLVAEHHTSPWLGLYPLTDGRWWLLAVSDHGEVIPNGDQVGTREAMLAAREALRVYQNWREIDGTAADLVEMAALATPQKGLRDLGRGVPRAVWIGAAAIAGVALLVGAGVFWYQQHEAAQLAVYQAQQRALAEARRAKQAAEAAVPPWTRLPAPTTLFAACAGAWHDQVLAMRGWRLSNWTCTRQENGIAIQVSWMRSGGTANDAPGVLVKPDQSSATRTVSTALAPSSAPAQRPEVAQRALWTVAQTRDLKLALADAPVPSFDSAKHAQEPPALWQQQNASVDMPAPPWIGNGPLFDAVPGFRIESVDYDSSRNAWRVNGALYAWVRDSSALRSRPTISVAEVAR